MTVKYGHSSWPLLRASRMVIQDSLLHSPSSPPGRRPPCRARSRPPFGRDRKGFLCFRGEWSRDTVGQGRYRLCNSRRAPRCARTALGLPVAVYLARAAMATPLRPPRQLTALGRLMEGMTVISGHTRGRVHIHRIRLYHIPYDTSYSLCCVSHLACTLSYVTEMSTASYFR